MLPEAPLVQTESGLVPAAEGWFILNAPKFELTPYQEGWFPESAA